MNANIFQKSSNLSVIGDVFYLYDPKSMFVWLDEYEECGPENPQPTIYLRQQVKAKLIEEINEGKNVENSWVTVFTYVWNWPVENENGELIAPVIERIESGDWLYHVNNKS